MICKGSQRRGGREFADYLLETIENETVELFEVRGAIAQDLHGALEEWQAISRGTKCQNHLYALSINPDHRKYIFKREQYLSLMEFIEKKLDLTGQPRAIVFHVKKDREHAHIVWSRIDTENMKAIHIAYDHRKLQAVAKDFARENGLELPAGMKKYKRQENREKHQKVLETQENETALERAARSNTISALWSEHSENPVMFVQALEKSGYVLARGNRPYVIVDREGRMHNLVRQIKGVDTKQVRDFLGEKFPSERLPDVESVQKLVLAKSS